MKRINHTGSTITLLIVFFIFLCAIIFYFAGYDVSKVPDVVWKIIKYFLELYLAIEAFEIVGELRYSVEGCANANNGNFYSCFPSSKLRVVNKREGNHFKYGWRHLGREDFEIVAKRNRFEDGDPNNSVFIRQKNNKIKRGGTGIYFFIF